MPPKRSLILRSAWSLNNEPIKSGSPVLISGFPIFLSVPHSLDNFVTVQSQADLSKKGVEQLHNFLNFPEPSDFSFTHFHTPYIMKIDKLIQIYPTKEMRFCVRSRKKW